LVESKKFEKNKDYRFYDFYDFLVLFFFGFINFSYIKGERKFFFLHQDFYKTCSTFDTLT